ncbi:hypothetical protein SAMN06269117_11348 [Balnearium lithotrophicum]|uniref:Uncharacterized protein n=1 Tax=Balnearium lithotrophicum TaxID=223788 RepID=A0A521CLR5_9BACT|nr:hypothetical protein [Balnearium lithotrophicum]SMO59691.1 hypothetical protein SAMN06269117_11348 [Balnearium lithotrophicum]
MWLWRCIDSVHVFVYDERKEMISLIESNIGCASVERNIPDLEAQLLENVAPKVVEKLKKLKLPHKYVVIAPLGVLWDRKAKVSFAIGISFGVALYKRLPKFLKQEKVEDYDPATYKPLEIVEEEIPQS